MEAAISSVIDENTPILRAARKHGVPNSTLHDRISGKVKHGKKPGPKQLLSAAEEEEFSSFLIEVSRAGYGKTRKEVKSVAGMVAVDKGRKSKPIVSDGWFRRFMQRQPHLSYRRGDPTANVRMNCLTKEVISDYFDLLKEVLTENQLLNSPNRIYNVDETGIALDGHAPRIVAKRGQKKVRYRTSGNKNQITVIACVSASGQCIPPFVIFDAKRLNMEWRKDEVVRTSYGLSDNGWVDSELFRGWLSEHFHSNAVSDRPILLLLDGHSLHYQPELISFAKQYEVILFCLPPHTTHESQPLDVSVFKSLKQNWQQACHNFIQSNPSLVITKYRFSGLFKEAWGKTMNPATISSGFRRCGVYPFNRDAIDCSVSVANPEASLQEVNKRDDKSKSTDQACDRKSTLPPEKAALFQQRYEEGYDIPDDEYMKWLRENHPESVTDQAAHSHNCNDLGSQSNSDGLSDNQICDGESTIPPEIKAAIFQRRYEEGYDIPDDEYMKWLKENHPESVTDQAAHSHNCNDLASQGSSDDLVDNQICDGESTISPEKAAVFQRRYEEGYDIPDDEYMKWLRDNHPEAAVEYPALYTGSNDYPSSLMNSLSYIPMASPVAILNSGSSMETGDETNDEVTSNTVECDDGLSETNAEGSNNMPVVSDSKIEEVGAKNTPSQTNDKLRYISKYLVQFVPDAKPQNKETMVRISGARVLTSEKCTAILKEREEKKRIEQEEKDRKKLLREKKRQEKEDEQRKKKILAAEKRAQAAEKRAQAAVRKRAQAEKRAQAAAKKAEKEAEKEANKANQQANKPSRKRQTDVHVSTTRSKLPRVDEASTTVDSEGENVCCVCFQCYQDDQEDSDWVQCACKRWLHEDCITDVVHDVHGRELFCPYCCR